MRTTRVKQPPPGLPRPVIFGGSLPGRHVIWWSRGKHGWDAVLLNRFGRSVNAVNYGFDDPPTDDEKDEAVRALSPTRRRRK